MVKIICVMLRQIIRKIKVENKWILMVVFPCNKKKNVLVILMMKLMIVKMKNKLWILMRGKVKK